MKLIRNLIVCLAFMLDFLSNAQTPSLVNFQMEDACQFDDFDITVQVVNYSILPNGVDDITFQFDTLLLVAYSTFPYQPTTNDIISVVGDTTSPGSGDTVTFALYAGEDFQGPPQVGVNFNFNFVADFNGTQVSLTDSATVKTLPTVSEIGPALELCETAEPYDLFNKVDVGGGTFEAIGAMGNGNVPSIVGDHYFDPSVEVSGSAPEFIYYTIVGGNGCENYISFDYPTIFDAPDVLVSTVDASCGLADGSAFASASGGSAPYNFVWSDGQITSSPVNLSSQVYQVFVTDANNCTTEKDVSIGNSDITASVTVNQPTCWYDNGDIDLTISATGNYTVWWSFGEFGEDHNDLPPGTYLATITTDTGCEEVVEAVISPSSPKITVNSVFLYDATCTSGTTNPDGFIELSDFDGGTLPYTFSWSNGVTDSINSGINPGTYDVLITDANGCEYVDTFTVGTFSSSSFYWIDVEEVTPSECNGSNGQVEVYFEDFGNEITSYSWSNGQTSTNLENVTAGDYTLTYTDVFGCTTNVDVTVPIQAPLINPICLISVDSTTTTNLIIWEREETNNIAGYNIYREEGDGVFNLRGYNPANEESIFNDVTASPKVKSWRYKISAVNTCGVEGELSLAHRTSHLKRFENGNDYTLNWNLYEGFDYTNNGIDVYRYTDATGWVLAATLGSTEITFNETVVNNAGIDYTIDFEPDAGACVSTKAQNHNSSRSNRTSGIFNPGEGTGDTNNELAELDLDNAVSIYPNPSKGVFNIELEGFENHIVNYQVFDIQGKVVANGSIEHNFTQLNFNGMESGVYVVQLTTDFHNTVKRIILE
jgi:hypothetical protein